MERSTQRKKVLVIHPFEDSIRKQYEKRRVLFKNPQLLPDFELKTLKAVQTSGSATDERFATWFDALQYMCDECDRIDLMWRLSAAVRMVFRLRHI